MPHVWKDPKSGAVCTRCGFNLSRRHNLVFGGTKDNHLSSAQETGYLYGQKAQGARADDGYDFSAAYTTGPLKSPQDDAHRV